MTRSDLPIWPIPDAQNDKFHVGAQFIAPSRHTTQAHTNKRLDVGAQFIAPSRYGTYELVAMNCAPTSSHCPLKLIP